MAERKMITWTAEKLKRFKSRYLEAVQYKLEQFEFDGDEYVVGYAKYLIEYLESKFGKEPL